MNAPPEMLSQAWSCVQSRAPCTCCEDLSTVKPCSPTWTTPTGLQGDKGPRKAATDLEYPVRFPEPSACLLIIPGQLSVVLHVNSRRPTSPSTPLFLTPTARCQ